MPEIGETLRETRMRRRIDMTEVEAATKIRAKYLRALENEEWDLLPGPTFVKTFLRTYAEYLELDSRLLVEEYRRRYERPSTQDLRPFKPGAAAQRRRRRRGPSGPAIVVVLGTVVLLAVLYVIGTKWGGDNGGETPPVAATATATATPTPTPKPKRKTAKKKAAPKVVSLKLTARQLVYVCVVDARGRAVVNGLNLQAGKSTSTLRSSRFRVNLGNANVKLAANGKSYPVANTGSPVGYELRPGRTPKRLAESVRAGLCRQ
jgi:cytoskeleton protein RodZ